MPTKKAAAIGTYGIFPNLDDEGGIETTVFTVGSAGTPWGAAIGVLHLLTWLSALIAIFAWGNRGLDEASSSSYSTTVSAPCKNLGLWYGIVPIGILVVVVFHSMFAKRQDMFLSTMASVILLWLVFFELSLGCAYLAYSMSVNDDVYSAAMFCQIAVTGGCAMVVTFYVNYTHNGDLNDTILNMGDAPSSKVAI
tara:strand:- start:17 stop:601 length:585 start_codon:yes stop_codon:yes gene_type:complete